MNAAVSEHTTRYKQNQHDTSGSQRSGHEDASVTSRLPPSLQRPPPVIVEIEDEDQQHEREYRFTRNRF